MPSNDKPRLLPTGNCWCGCGEDANIGKFFAQGHDKTAESALIALEYDGSVPHFLHAHGYGPQHSVTKAAVDKTDWQECTCGYRGAPDSIRRHQKKSGHTGTMAKE
ncbi:hypothetical protein [Streptomyces sparsogenes]|uniref:hypothetical protein n=1 Tax=Streptomyces sparsogenes TaxID=67365 RepID=UPI0033D05602